VTQSLHGLLTSAGTARLDKTFLDGHAVVPFTYGQFFDLSNRMAAVIAAAIRPGDRVMAQVQKSPEAFAAYLGTLAAGGVFVPLNTAYTRVEAAELVRDAQPALRIADPDASLASVDDTSHLLTLDPGGRGSLPDAIATADPLDPVRLDMADPAVMLYTSGTTGQPKGVVLSGANLASNARMLHDGWHFEEDDRLLHMLPMFHVHGLFVAMHPVLLAGASVSFHTGFEVDAVLEDIPRCSVVMGVPTMYTRLLADRRLDRSLAGEMRLFTCGSAPLPAPVHQMFTDRTGHSIVERYGMTEAGIITSNPYDGDRIAGTVGFPLEGVRLRVVDEDGSSVETGTIGTVETTGPNVFERYWRRPEATEAAFAPDGWLRTGDVGSISSDGRLTLEGRASDLIISGGLNVSPRQVEDALQALPSIEEVAIVGIPHPDFGEAVVGFVVSHDFDLDEVERVLADVARFKHPKRWIRLAALPRNAMGKVQKSKLRADHLDLFE
jgi:malonyl-CoA/methylmalonyl-CoA synthetase